MDNWGRIKHLAMYSKKLRVRKKNKHRIANTIKIKVNRRNVGKLAYFGVAKDVVFHEYEDYFDKWSNDERGE